MLMNLLASRRMLGFAALVSMGDRATAAVFMVTIGPLQTGGTN